MKGAPTGWFSTKGGLALNADMQIHPFAPTRVDEDSRILILGSFPSVVSREVGFYYANKQNRFWKLLCAIFGENLPPLDSVNIATYQDFLTRHGLVLWDITKQCEITRSDDASLKVHAFNDIYALIKNTNIRTICLNGATATKLFKIYQSQQTHTINNLKIHTLPSTSPRNARYDLERLVKAYQLAIKS
ncbi:DNA-deoxyinosine glycosylase [Helicobacter sp. MIT 00-7814]|uniref:DNA-deoxyinosine glycosylase n=1 Tax=unclassified Helicobacter TaxID=2593540 RepID=UPI000E1F01E6|nr:MULTISPECIES: DNA-deoxyinosine glycosylase [unclassified Helicobacter]RDU54813.1 DNA-deoxyinosine glycosylase [Helicobacter sp. MIT 99-10781]RDU54871.1 DNA-deoxyinosine glycosylase [Helicobacter sp. MIT 00-7814]